MRGFQLIQSLTDIFRAHGNAGRDVIVYVPGAAYTYKVASVGRQGDKTVLKLERL